MKRFGNLWAKVTAFENLLLASRKARRGKRFWPNVLNFEADLEENLLLLQQKLTSKTYRPGPYRVFYIKEPKPRMISASPYIDRVVHHALCNIIEPIFDRTFTSDSFANRKGYGTHRALRRFTAYARKSSYLLQCDIRRYFPSIDHAILKILIRRKIKCVDTLWLIDLIIDHSNSQEPINHFFPGDDLLTVTNRRIGLPMGNLTSQFFANVYLNGLDHFIKETLRIDWYVRYVDDFALFDNDSSRLALARQQLEAYLLDLRLVLHPVKTQLVQTRLGANFLGFRVLPNQVRIRTENLRRARHRIRRLQSAFAKGKVALDRVMASMRSWNAHLAHGDTWRLRERLFDKFVFQKDS
jgi:retron-type reverse transcriptase